MITTCAFCGLVVRPEQFGIVMNDPSGSGQLVVMHRPCVKRNSIDPAPILVRNDHELQNL
jgi:hypothetical protein